MGQSSTLLLLVLPGKEECDRLQNSLPRTAAKKKHPTSLGQLGQAVNGINTSQDATETKSIGNPFYRLPRIQEKHKIQFPSHLAKSG